MYVCHKSGSVCECAVHALGGVQRMCAIRAVVFVSVRCVRCGCATLSVGVMHFHMGVRLECACFVGACAGFVGHLEGRHLEGFASVLALVSPSLTFIGESNSRGLGLCCAPAALRLVYQK